jgi:DNA-binding CsgD family transcriptional regulator
MADLFVGRVAEVAALSDLRRRVAEEGRPGAALILGPPGQGKSRLLTEIGRRPGVRLLRVAGYEPERDVPLAAATGLLHDLTGVGEPGATLAAVLAGELGGGGALESVRVFEAASRARRALGPALIAVDDLQWVDDLTLALCHYLARSAVARPEPLVVVAAGRPSPRVDRFAAALATCLADALGVETIELPPLADDEALRLARAVAPALSDAEAADVVRRGAGSPFWVRGLAEGGPGRDATRVVSIRLGAADGDARALVAALAVAGRPLTPSSLVVVMDWEPRRACAAIEGAVATGLVLESAGRIGLAHDLIREAALGEVTHEARRALHRGLARALEREAGDDATLLLAALAHRRAAGERALDLALRIARSPSVDVLGADGVRDLAAVAEDAGSGSDAWELGEVVAGLASAAGEHGLALELWSRLADGAPEPARRRRATLSGGWSAFALGRGSEARALLARARASGPSPSEELSADALEASVLIWLENRILDGAALADTASQAVQARAAASGGCEFLDAAERRVCLQAFGAAFDAALRRDDHEAIGPIAELMIDASRGFDHEAYLDALRHRAVAAYELGHLGEAAAQLERICDEARRRFLPAAEVRSSGYLARALLAMGRLEEARAALTRVELIPVEADLPGWRHLPRVRWEIELLRGDSLRACAELAQLARAEQNPHARLHAERKLLQAVARLEGPGRREEVARLVSDADASADAAGCVNCAADLGLEAAEALARVGMTGGARARLERTPQRAGEQRALWRRWTHALLADAADAAALLAAVVEDAERLGRRLDALWAGLDLGRALALSDSERAEASLRRLEAGAEALGSATHSALARRELRRLGVRNWRRGSGGPAALTEREREIAALAASGATNPEIARAVFLSRKTVERHVSAALAKLGARNRTELASRLTALERTGEGAEPVEGPPS